MRSLDSSHSLLHPFPIAVPLTETPLIGDHTDFSPHFSRGASAEGSLFFLFLIFLGEEILIHRFLAIQSKEKGEIMLKHLIKFSLGSVALPFVKLFDVIAYRLVLL